MMWWTLRLLKSKNVRVRLIAVERLGSSSRHPRAVDLCVSALADSHQWVRAAAALDALKWEPQQDSVLAQLAILPDRWNEAAKLGAAAVEPLIAALAGPTPDVRANAALALGEIGDARAASTLTTLLAHDCQRTREAAAQAVERLKTPTDESRRALAEYRANQALRATKVRRDAEEAAAVRFGELLRQVQYTAARLHEGGTTPEHGGVRPG